MKLQMAEKWKNNQSSVAETISHRTGVGQNELLGGWHALLSDLLNSMRSYLMPAQIITFQHLSPQEKQQFQHIFNRVHVPDSACGVYLPSSVRNQLMYSNQGLEIPVQESTPRDDGVLLFSRLSSHSIIINVLLAHPPYTPAVDVYEEGALLAGYVYGSLDECLAAIEGVVQTHLR